MMKTQRLEKLTAALLALLLSGGASLFAAPAAKKPAAKKPAAAAAKKAPAAQAPAPEEKKAQAAAAPAETPSAQDKAAQAEAPADESLDVTITGESKDELPLTMDAPPTDIPFERVAGLSREGQTDRVLSGPIEHMTGEDQMHLLQMDSHQAYLGLPGRIPSAPFIRMEIAPGLSAARWELDILDQDDATTKVMEGDALPKHLAEWDGFQNGAFKLRTGPAYTPVLVLTDERNRVQRYFGEPVHFAALQYIQDGVHHLEFDNNRLFERGRAGFAQDMTAYLFASLNVLRQRLGKPIRVVVYAAPGGKLPTQKRLDNLKTFYKEGLVPEADSISFAVLPMTDRGDVTEITTQDK
jgi:hypothetical protein